MAVVLFIRSRLRGRRRRPERRRVSADRRMRAAAACASSTCSASSLSSAKAGRATGSFTDIDSAASNGAMLIGKLITGRALLQLMQYKCHRVQAIRYLDEASALDQRNKRSLIETTHDFGFALIFRPARAARARPLDQIAPTSIDELDASLSARANNIARMRESKGRGHTHRTSYLFFKAENAIGGQSTLRGHIQARFGAGA
jgi:hypothetical protein